MADFTPITLSHHRRQLLQRCALAHYWKYTRRLQLGKQNIHFFYGNALHSALAQYYKSKMQTSADDILAVFLDAMSESRIDMEHQSERSQYEKIGRILLPAYIKSTQTDDFDVLSVEQTIVLPVTPNGSVDKTASPHLAGIFVKIAVKPDLVVQNKDGVWCIDHKTTSLEREDFESDMMQDTQLYDYCLVLSHLYPDLQGGIFNVFRKELRHDPLFRFRLPVSSQQMSSSMEDFLNAAELHYMTVGTHLETAYSRQRDCKWCEYKDPCYLQRIGGDAEKCLSLYYIPTEHFDWEETNGNS